MKQSKIYLCKRGLSPLLATAILISATIAGGAILYQYFNKSISMYISTSSIETSFSLLYLPGDRFAIYYSIINRSENPVNLSHIYFLPNGSLTQIPLGNRTLYPGNKLTGIQEFSGSIPSYLYGVVVFYQGVSRLETKPIEVTS